MGAEPGLVIVLEMPEGEFGVLVIVGFEVGHDFEEAMAVRIAAGFFEESEEGAVAEMGIRGGGGDGVVAGFAVELGHVEFDLVQGPKGLQAANVSRV